MAETTEAERDLVDARAVAEIADVKLETIYHYHKFGRMPKATQYFGRSPVWERQTIEDWVVAKNARRTNRPKESTNE